MRTEPTPVEIVAYAVLLGALFIGSYYALTLYAYVLAAPGY